MPSIGFNKVFFQTKNAYPKEGFLLGEEKASPWRYSHNKNSQTNLV